MLSLLSALINSRKMSQVFHLLPRVCLAPTILPFVARPRMQVATGGLGWEQEKQIGGQKRLEKQRSSLAKQELISGDTATSHRARWEKGRGNGQVIWTSGIENRPKQIDCERGVKIIKTHRYRVAIVQLTQTEQVNLHVMQIVSSYAVQTINFCIVLPAASCLLLATKAGEASFNMTVTECQETSCCVFMSLILLFKQYIIAPAQLMCKQKI